MNTPKSHPNEYKGITYRSEIIKNHAQEIRDNIDLYVWARLLELKNIFEQQKEYLNEDQSKTEMEKISAQDLYLIEDFLNWASGKHLDAVSKERYWRLRQAYMHLIPSLRWSRSISWVWRTRLDIGYEPYEVELDYAKLIEDVDALLTEIQEL